MSQIQRRTFLKAGAGVAAVAATSVGLSAVTKKDSTSQVESFFGKHQSGVATPPQEHGTWLSFNLNPGVDRDALSRLMRVWTTDAARLMEGRPALADNEETLAGGLSNLTITFGFGPKISGGLEMVHQVPALSIDKLEQKWSGGDLLIQICGNDLVKIHHATRELIADAKPFAELNWQQNGFLPKVDLDSGNTPRNLMGQKDGTANFLPDSNEFNDTVWIKNGPAAGGTIMVIRRIQMKLDQWEKLSPDLKSKAIGRDIQSGAPLSGGEEFTPADFQKSDHHGLVIPGDSHVRRARIDQSRIHRRGYNYSTEISGTAIADQGLVFISFQASLHQFMQIQKRLESMDSLNTWTTPIGSAVFLIPPGVENGQWIGQTII